MEVKSRTPEPSPRLDPGSRPRAAASLQTFAQLIEQSVRLYADRTALARRNSRGGEPVTYAQLGARVRNVAAGLAARGLGAGDRVALIAENRYEWLCADLATTYIGAVDVPRGVDTSPAEMRFILEHSGSRFAFVENDAVAAEIVEMRAGLPELRSICTLEDRTALPAVITLPALEQEGASWLAANAGALAEIAERVQPDDLLTIVYTSGTTADPKGVMLTHANVLSNVRTANQVLGFGPRDRFLSALPPWHMYERMMEYVVLAFGAELIYTDRRRLKEDLAKQSPTVFAAVPRMWEAIYNGIVAECRKLPPRRRALMSSVLETCGRIGAGAPTWRDRLLHPVLRATLLRRFQRLTGGRLRIAVSGGGALPDNVDRTLLGLGIPLLNGYGLTETSPVVAVRRPGDRLAGTIGPPLPETEVEIRDANGRRCAPGETGVIWIRGPGVMKGYYRNPARTAAVLVDGWFDSGDLGSIGADGKLRITGRAKDTIVLSGGENVEPEPIETAIKISPYIEQAVVVGQDKKTLGALLMVSDTALEQRIPRQEWGVEGPLLTAEGVRRLFRGELDALLSRENGFRNVDRIAHFQVIHEPMTPDNGFLTATLKVKRHVVMQRYGDVIERMFG